MSVFNTLEMRLNDETLALNNLRDSLAKETVNSMQAIAQCVQEALSHYSTNRQYLQKCIWYSEHLLKACEEKNQQKMISFIRKDNKHIIGYLNPHYFDKIPDDHPILKYRSWQFLAKSSVAPSDALNAVFQTLAIMDCGMACQTARYFALYKILGKPKFNRLFGSQVGQLLNIGYNDDSLQPMRYFVDFSQAVYKQIAADILPWLKPMGF